MTTLPAIPKRPLPALRRGDRFRLGRDAILVRVYARLPYNVGWNTFRTFGPTDRGRFDHQPPPPANHPDRGILYAAGDGATAIVEAFQKERLINPNDTREIWLATFRSVRDVALLDLRGAWPTRAGASQALATGDAPEISQTWARAIWEDYPEIEGVFYPSSMRGRPGGLTRLGSRPVLAGQNIALFERAEDALPAHPTMHLPLGHPGLADLLGCVADTYSYDLG